MQGDMFYLTPAAGKRLIAFGIAAMDEIRDAVLNRSVLIVSGTTNAFVAEELLRLIGEEKGFDARAFRRGFVAPRWAKVDDRLFNGDVLIREGKWIRGREVSELAGELREGDVLFKGANAVNLREHEAGVLIGNPQGGTMMPVVAATIGRRVRLMVPVGVEKRVESRISELAAMANAPGMKGLRLCSVPGEVYTELDAIRTLTGLDAQLLAAGGVNGAEGGAYFAARGDQDEIDCLHELVERIEMEPSTIM